MKIRCIHGYFIFEESEPGEAGRFMDLFQGLELVAKDWYFTFLALLDAPDYALGGSTYMGAPSSQTFAGQPWDVMRANGLVYNFNSGRIEPVTSVTQRVKLSAAGNYFLSPGLILPGSITDDGSRVTDYSAWYQFKSAIFKYSEVG